MSRAFVKEEDTSEGGNLPDRPISTSPNYVTPTGLRQLHEQASALEAQRLSLLAEGDDAAATDQLANVDRDLRYVVARIGSAILVDPAAQPRDEVAFGAAVTVLLPNGTRRTFAIVGEDEADLKDDKISCISPLAEALLGARRGDSVTWKRPAGDLLLTIESIEPQAG